MRNEECSFWEQPGLTDEKTLFTSTCMCNGWWSNCWPFCHSCPHNPYDGYNPPQFAVLWLFLPHCRKHLLLGHCEYSSTCKCLHFSVLLSSVLGLVACLSCSAWQCHKSKSVSLPNQQIIQGKKRNCPCIICGHVLKSSLSVLLLSHGLLSCAVPCTACPSPGIL